MRIADDLPCPSLTLALTPGTIRLLQPRHVYLFMEASSLMLNLSLTRLARAACCFAMAMSFEARLTDDSVSFLTSATASCLAAFRALTP